MNVIRDNVKVYFFNPEGKRIQVNKYTVHNLTGFIPAGEIKKTLLRYRYLTKTEKYLSQYLYLKSVYRIIKVNRTQSSLITALRTTFSRETLCWYLQVCYKSIEIAPFVFHGVTHIGEHSENL